jgi:hypothetical protein
MKYLAPFLALVMLCGCTLWEQRQQANENEQTITQETGTDPASGRAYSKKIVTNRSKNTTAQITFETPAVESLLSLLGGALTGNTGTILSTLAGGLVAAYGTRKVHEHKAKKAAKTAAVITPIPPDGAKT